MLWQNLLLDFKTWLFVGYVQILQPRPYAYGATTKTIVGNSSCSSMHFNEYRATRHASRRRVASIRLRAVFEKLALCSKKKTLIWLWRFRNDLKSI